MYQQDKVVGNRLRVLPALHGLDELLMLHAQQTPSIIVIVHPFWKVFFFFRFAKVGLVGWER